MLHLQGSSSEMRILSSLVSSAHLGSTRETDTELVLSDYVICECTSWVRKDRGDMKELAKSCLRHEWGTLPMGESPRRNKKRKKKRECQLGIGNLLLRNFKPTSHTHVKEHPVLQPECIRLSKAEQSMIFYYVYYVQPSASLLFLLLFPTLPNMVCVHKCWRWLIDYF